MGIRDYSLRESDAGNAAFKVNVLTNPMAEGDQAFLKETGITAVFIILGMIVFGWLATR